MVKLKNILDEASGTIQKGGWIQLSGKALDKFKDEISDLIAIASKNGKNISGSDIEDKDGYKYMAVNLDKDPGPDAIRIYKEKGSGKVIIGVGHDNSDLAKQKLYTMRDLRKGVESSDEGILGTLKRLIKKIF